MISARAQVSDPAQVGPKVSPGQVRLRWQGKDQAKAADTNIA